MPRRASLAWVIAIRLAIGVVSGVVLGYGLLALARESLYEISLRWLLLLPLWLLLAVAFHEAGHALAGAAVGMRFAQWQIGPLHVNRQYRPHRVTWNWKSWFAGGRVDVRPRLTSHLALRMGLLTAAGPAVSLLVAAAVYLLALSAIRHGQPLLADLLAAFWVVAATLFWISIAPHRRVGQMSDGSILGILSRATPERERWLAQIRMVTALETGVRPSAWPPEEVAALLAESNGPGMEGSLFLAYLAALDHGDWAAAGERLTRWAKETAPLPTAWRFAAAEAVWFFLMRRDDEPAARHWRQLLEERAGAGTGGHLRGECAIALLDGNPEAIRSALDHYRREIQALSHFPLTALDRAFLSEFEIRAGLAKTTDGSGTIEAQ